MLRDIAPSGLPDRTSAVPVSIHRLNDWTLSVDGEPRAIISCTGVNGKTTYLI
jgi:hypothetical protein